MGSRIAHIPAYIPLEKKTGLPMLLNTSFNNNAEPIVDSIDDAVGCYLTSGLDRLIIGDFLIEKCQGPLDPDIVSGLVPSLAASRRLTKGLLPDGPDGSGGLRTVYRLEGTQALEVALERGYLDIKH